MTDEQYNQLKGAVVSIITAMGGLEEVMGKSGKVEVEYVLGYDCLRCLRDLRKMWRQDDDDFKRVIPRIFAEVNLLQTGLLPLLLKASGMGEKGGKIALACSEFSLLGQRRYSSDTCAE
jgi:replication fork protection complex subunit Tof1/Swi1